MSVDESHDVERLLVSLRALGGLESLPQWGCTSADYDHMGAGTTTTCAAYTCSRDFGPWIDLLPLGLADEGRAGTKKGLARSREKRRIPIQLSLRPHKSMKIFRTSSSTFSDSKLSD
jgi:hypothetical protein